MLRLILLCALTCSCFTEAEEAEDPCKPIVTETVSCSGECFVEERSDGLYLCVRIERKA